MTTQFNATRHALSPTFPSRPNSTAVTLSIIFLLYTRGSDTTSHLFPFLTLNLYTMPRRRKPTGVCTICGVSGHVSRFCRLQTPARSGRKPSAEIAKGPNVGFNSGQGGQHPPVRPSQQQADIQPEKQSTMPRQRRTLPLNADDDNTGEALWRSGKTPTTVFRLPDSFDPLAFGDANTKFNRLHQVAIDTRTYIVRKKGSDIEIYGSPNDAAEAKSRILAWVEEYDLPKRSKRRSDSWTKINNITPDQRDQIDKRIMREEKRNQWRKPPDIKNGKYMHRVSSTTLFHFPAFMGIF